MKKEEVLKYWESNVYEGDLGCDFSDGLTRCWRCGCKRELFKSLIIPLELGGLKEPSNVILLCEQCKNDAPVVDDRTYIWKWIKMHKRPFYDIFWFGEGMIEYKLIFKVSEKEFEKKIMFKYQDITSFYDALVKKVSEYENILWHYPNKSTIAFLIKELLA